MNNTCSEWMNQLKQKYFFILEPATSVGSPFRGGQSILIKP